MRRFSFTLESVLIVKQKILENERIKLARILNIYNRQKEALEEIINKFKNIQIQADEYASSGNFNVEIISNYRKYSFKLSQDIKTQEKMIEKTSQELTKQQTATNKAYIEVKTLEKLKEKQKEKYEKEFLNEEFKTIDDIVSSRYARLSY